MFALAIGEVLPAGYTSRIFAVLRHAEVTNNRPILLRLVVNVHICDEAI